MSDTPIFLKLAMGLEKNLPVDNELGKISYASDSHNLYINSKKKKKDNDGYEDERQQIDARYSTGLKYNNNFIKINLDADNMLSFFKVDDSDNIIINTLNLKVNKLTANSISINDKQISQENGSFDTLYTKKIVIGNENDNITIERVVKENEENIKHIKFSADKIFTNNDEQLITKEAVNKCNYATKEEVKQIASQIKPDTSMTAIWHCGDVPPDDTKLLWIRTGVGFGNGVLYYYNPPTLDYENGNETIEIYFNGSKSKIIKYGKTSFESGILKFDQKGEIEITDDTTENEFSVINENSYDIKILLDENITNNNDILKEQDIRGISFEGCILDNDKIIGICITSSVLPDASEPNNWTPMSAIYT